MLTLNQAMAPLQGVSILIKEHYSITSIPSTCVRSLSNMKYPMF